VEIVGLHKNKMCAKLHLMFINRIITFEV